MRLVRLRALEVAHMRPIAKIALAAVSLLLVSSMGGGFLALPALIPLHIWAARTSGRLGRVLWSALPVIGAGMVTWAVTYAAVAEAQPAIWLVPVLAMMVTALVIADFTRPNPAA
jgi:hypothetical protein